jgi:CHAT domain
MKILILSANPKNTQKLRLDEEVRNIQLGLERAKRRSRFEIVSCLAVRTEDLRRALLDHEPQIVHFCGHGVGEQGLLFESDGGEAKSVSAESLSGLFKLFSNQIKCVLLNACYSETQAKAICQHISYVIGMEQAIGDKAAIRFTVGFYDALYAGRSIKDAFEFGRNAIDLEGISETLAPKIFAKDGETLSLKENEKQEDLGKVQYFLVLTAKLDEINKAEAEAIVAHLRQLLGDASLTLNRMDPGSVIFQFEGSEDGLRKLESLVSNKQLTELLNKPIKEVSELRVYLIQELAHKIALDYSIKDLGTIGNELNQAHAYLRKIVNESDAKTRFFKYLQALAKHGSTIGHSNRTKDYYWNMNEVLDKYLKDDKIDVQLMLEIIGWSARLMRYYKVAPIGETSAFEVKTEESAAVVTRRAEIEKLKAKQTFEVGQILDATVDKKHATGSHVTYLIEGVPFREKEAKTFNKIPESGTVKVQVKSLKGDGSINHVKFVEP